jgi:hypothetical protein
MQTKNYTTQRKKSYTKRVILYIKNAHTAGFTF